MSFITNIVGFTKKSNLPKLGKSFTYNMYAKIDSDDEHSFNQVLLPMPGYKKYSESWDIPGEPQGMYKISRGRDGKPKLYGIWDKVLYLIDGNNKYRIAKIAGSGKCTFAETSGYGGSSHPHLCICDGVSVYAVDVTMDPVAQSKDFKTILMPIAYPGNDTSLRAVPSWIAYLYGYLVVGAADTDIFYTSYQYPFEKLIDGEIDYDIFMATEGHEDMGGLGHYTMSEWQPDNTLTGCANGSRLFTFGERSFQVFTYQNSATQPFASPDTASKNIGIRNKDSLAHFGDNVFWLGSSDMGENIIYMMDGNANPTRISTDEIEDMIRGYSKTTIKSFCMNWKSHPMYVISFLSDDITLAYDISVGGWINLGSRKSAGTEGCYRYCNATVSPEGDLCLQCAGNLVKACEPTLRSDGTYEGSWFEHDNTPILRKRAGGMLSSDHKRFKLGSIKLMTNNGDYPLVIDRPPLITMRISSDGQTWNSCATYALGKVGNYGYDVIFRPHQKVDYLTVEFATSENIGFALYGMDIKGVSCGR